MKGKYWKIIVLLIIALLILTSVILLFKSFYLFNEKKVHILLLYAYYQGDSENDLSQEKLDDIYTILTKLKVKRSLNKQSGYQATDDTLEIGVKCASADNDITNYHITVIPNGRCWIYDPSMKDLFIYDITNPEEIIKWAETNYKM